MEDTFHRAPKCIEELFIMVTPYSGQCACGAVRYSGTSDPAFAWNCQCRDCQRASGGGQCPIFYAPSSSVAFTGNVSFYEVKAESGNAVNRGFCGNCGSPICIRAELVPDLVGIWAGSLDDPDQFSPQIYVWKSSAPKWLVFDDKLPSCSHAPTAEQMKQLLSP